MHALIPIAWFESNWWQSFREFGGAVSVAVGIVAALVAVVSFANSVAIHRQELSARRFHQTATVIDDYNVKRVSLITPCFAEFDRILPDEIYSELRSKGEQRLKAVQYQAINKSKLIGVLHYLNLLGYYLENEQYIVTDDLIQSFRTELNHYFGKRKYQTAIASVLELTSMKYVGKLLTAIGVERL